MRDQLVALFELQSLDSQIYACEQVVAGVLQEAAETKAVIDKTQLQLEKLLSRQSTNDRDRVQLENDLAGDREKLRKWEVRYDDIRNSREAAALSREIEGLKRQNRGSEEQILEYMQRAEDLSQEIDELSTRADGEEKEYRALRDKSEGGNGELNTELEEHNRARESLSSKVRPEFLRKYDRVRKARQGIGMVQVVQGTCLGCHMQLPPQQYNDLQRGTSLEVCPTCNRILFWELPPESEED